MWRMLWREREVALGARSRSSCPSLQSGKAPGGRNISAESCGMNKCWGKSQRLRSVCVWGAVRVWECSRLGTACAKAQKQRGPKILGELGGEHHGWTRESLESRVWGWRRETAALPSALSKATLSCLDLWANGGLLKGFQVVWEWYDQPGVRLLVWRTCHGMFEVRARGRGHL